MEGAMNCLNTFPIAVGDAPGPDSQTPHTELGAVPVPYPVPESDPVLSERWGVIQQVVRACKRLENSRDMLGFDIDGTVLKVSE